MLFVQHIVLFFCQWLQHFDCSCFWYIFKLKFLTVLIPWYLFPLLNWVLNLSVKWGTLSHVEIVKQCIYIWSSCCTKKVFCGPFGQLEGHAVEFNDSYFHFASVLWLYLATLISILFCYVTYLIFHVFSAFMRGKWLTYWAREMKEFLLSKNI